MRLNLTKVKLLNATEPPETYSRWERNKPQILTIEMPETMVINPAAPIFIYQNPDIDPDVTQLFYITPELERCTITSLNIDTQRDFAGATTIELAGIHNIDPTKPLYITQDPNHG